MDVSLMRRSRFTHQKKYLELMPVSDRVDPNLKARLEGLGQFIFSDLVGDQTSDLPACNEVPQPAMLLRAPISMLC
jgi:hypothetical protein